MYRFSKKNVQTILSMIKEDFVKKDPRGGTIPPFLRLCVFLSYCGGNSQQVTYTRLSFITRHVTFNNTLIDFSTGKGIFMESSSHLCLGSLQKFPTPLSKDLAR